MYPPDLAARHPDRTAFVMAGSGDSLTFAELDARSAQLAHALGGPGGLGVEPGDALALVLPNDVAWPVGVAAGMRSGLEVVPINWHLGARELAVLLAEAAPAALLTTSALLPAVLEAVHGLPRRPHVLLADVGGDAAADLGALALWDRIADLPTSPPARELLGARVLFSGGTTGRPKAYRQPLLGVHPREAPRRHPHLAERLGLVGPEAERGVRFLSPAPSYHAAPFTFQLMTLAAGGTVVCLESFDAVAALEALTRLRVTHSQWVPTMLSRLLAVPAALRPVTTSSHRVAVTSGAPCPPALKDAIMDWWGEILHEYYGASEGYGHTYVSPHEARTHRGSVGRPLGGARVVITDDDGAPLGTDVIGRVCFEGPDGALRGMGDMGRLDADGFLHLTGRATFMIVSGGVNVYPEEVEEALADLPEIADAAVFGVPHADLGEQVMAVVEPARGAPDAAALTVLVQAHCRDRLAGFKVPRRIDVVERLPRLETGKLDKRALRASYLTACPDRPA